MVSPRSRIDGRWCPKKFGKHIQYQELGNEVHSMTKHRRAFWQRAAQRALYTHKVSIRRVKAKLTRMGWQCCTFQTRRKHPLTGIVDLVAIRRNTKNPDRLQVVLFQVKGGSAKSPDHRSRRRLQRAPSILEIGYEYATYKKGRPIKFPWNPDEFLDKIKLSR